MARIHYTHRTRNAAHYTAWEWLCWRWLVVSFHWRTGGNMLSGRGI